MNQSASPASASEARKNRLAEEKSLYLRQHAGNPVDWYPWSAEVHGRAVELDRPILLSIGYSSCHWCHVMEKEVFSDEGVAKFLNENFISIKVDREEMPEIDHFYMTSAQAMGLGGGWPLNVFLTPELKPFYAVTYMPSQAFLGLSRRVAELWRGDRQLVESQAASLVQALASSNVAATDEKKTTNPGDRPRPGSGREGGAESGPGGEYFEKLLENEKQFFDEQWGGLLGRAKFPTPARWHFLLHLYRWNGHQGARDMVTKTLDAMASGGIRDHLGGGFHRYAVDRQWLVPHFEKMLYDNALLADLYLEAGLALDRPDYLQVAWSTLDFITGIMGDRPRGGPRGGGAGGAGFASSLDADSPAGEGAYFVWTREQLEAVAGAEAGGTLARILGVADGPGQVSGGWVLTRRASGDDRDEELLERWRERLLAARERRPAPALDAKVVTAWNSMAIRVLARAALAAGKTRYLEAAGSAMEYLDRVHLAPDGSLARASNHGRATGRGVLEDYAWMAAASLALFQASGDLPHAERALLLARQAVERFARPDGQYALAERNSAVPVGGLPAVVDMPTPSGGAVLAHVMLELYELTADSTWLQRLQEALAAVEHSRRRGGLDLAWWHDAALLQRTGQALVVVAGSGEDRARVSRQLAGRLPPQLVLAPVAAAGLPANRIESFPALAEKTAGGEQPRLFLCSGVTCRAPTHEVSVLAAALQSGWQH